jgi:hypothetical protein
VIVKSRTLGTDGEGGRERERERERNTTNLDDELSLEGTILEDNITIYLGKVEWKPGTALDSLGIGSNGNLSSTLNNLLAALTISFNFNCSSRPSATEYVTYQSPFDLRT